MAYFTWFGFRGVNRDGSLKNSNKLDWRLAGTIEEARHEVEVVLNQLLEPTLNRRESNWIGTEEYLQHMVAPSNIEEGEDEQE
jgi:hypothetical protein